MESLARKEVIKTSLSLVCEFKKESDRAYISGLVNQQPRIVRATWRGGKIVKATYDWGVF